MNITNLNSMFLLYQKNPVDFEQDLLRRNLMFLFKKEIFNNFIKTKNIEDLIKWKQFVNLNDDFDLFWNVVFSYHPINLIEFLKMFDQIIFILFDNKIIKFLYDSNNDKSNDIIYRFIKRFYINKFSYHDCDFILLKEFLNKLIKHELILNKEVLVLNLWNYILSEDEMNTVFSSLLQKNSVKNRNVVNYTDLAVNLADVILSDDLGKIIYLKEHIYFKDFEKHLNLKKLELV